MINYITVLIQNNNSKELEKFFYDMYNSNINFWMIYKGNGIRLRVNSFDKELVTKLCEKYNNIKFNLSNYEPEIYTFGGRLTTDIIHNILCVVSVLSIQLNIRKNKDFVIAVKILLKIVSYSSLDKFEEWDIWKRVSEHRKIATEKDLKIICDNLYNIYLSLNKEEVYNSEIIELNLNKLKNYITELKEITHNNFCDRGFRSIVSSIVIFSMNILKIEASYQIGVVNAITILKNPDFVMELKV